MKKIIGFFLITAVTLALFTSCQTKKNTSGFDSESDITVVSREDGSGTRGAFIELFHILKKDENGNKTDMTTQEAIIANKTDVMLTNISQDKYAIGYVSLGSLQNTVKVLKIDSVEPNAENVKNGTYKIARPFNIATKGEPSPIVKDFINFILSKQGQEIVAKSYIEVNSDAKEYVSINPSGKIVIAGSSSVTPIMEKLKEGYLAINKKVGVEIQQSDSTAGMTAVKEGTCDIGMASRELKDSEKADLTSTEIALDGIAVIVNNANNISELTSEQVKGIFTGEITSWSEVE